MYKPFEGTIGDVWPPLDASKLIHLIIFGSFGWEEALGNILTSIASIITLGNRLGLEICLMLAPMLAKM